MFWQGSYSSLRSNVLIWWSDHRNCKHHQSSLGMYCWWWITNHIMVGDFLRLRKSVNQSNAEKPFFVSRNVAEILTATKTEATCWWTTYTTNERALFIDDIHARARGRRNLDLNPTYYDRWGYLEWKSVYYLVKAYTPWGGLYDLSKMFSNDYFAVQWNVRSAIFRWDGGGRYFIFKSEFCPLKSRSFS